MRADSLALDSPGQVLREVRGFGTAWLGGTASTRPPKSATGCGATPSSPRSRPPDSAGTRRAVLSRIEARTAAQSYHLDRNAKVPTPAVDQLRAGRRHHGHHEGRRRGRRRGPGGHPGQGGRHPARGRRPTRPPRRRPTPPGRQGAADEHARVDRRARRPRSVGGHRAGGDHPRRRARATGRRSPTWS